MRGRHILGYTLLLLVFVVAVLAVLKIGTQRWPADLPARASAVADNGNALLQHLSAPLSILLLQVIAVIVTVHVAGLLFRPLGQPAVVGAMIAGILLGPSLFGWVWPAGHAFLFPANSLGALRLLSQIGVILFMFAVGMNLDVTHLRAKAHAAVLVSHASIVAPFLLGTALTLVLYRELAPVGVPFSSVALFMGVSMSITAFPVLARIIEEHGLTKTALGNTAIACAAVDDVTAWCLLAVVVALANAQALAGAFLTILLTLGFVGVMFFVMRPLAKRWANASQTHNAGALVIVLVFVFAASLTTEVIGIHALFGAFLAGVVMPANAALRDELRQNVEVFSTAFLLPLFFAFTGLRTEIGLLNDAAGWGLCLVVVAVAVVGKLGGSALAARWTGMPGREALALGVMMNTRGLVELIVLNIGYDLGILSARSFAVMVLMALITTCMTGPLLTLLGYARPGKD